MTIKPHKVQQEKKNKSGTTPYLIGASADKKMKRASHTDK
jgi:hypothetical protein